MRTASIRAEWEGRILDARFPLLEWLGGSDDRGVFLTVLQGIQRAAVKLILAEPPEAVAYLARWEAAKSLSHPNLAPILEMGRCEIEGTSLVYVITEIAERVLSHFIQDRPLKVTEVNDILEPIIDALSYLHQKGFVHGHIKPPNILIIGGELKISGDEFLVLPGIKNQLVNPILYDAPEVATGPVTAAADSWSLGMTICEALLQRPPIWKRTGDIEPIVPDTLPAPFLRIVQDCLRIDPARRCTLEEIRSRLGSVSTTPAAPQQARTIPAPVSRVPELVPEPKNPFPLEDAPDDALRPRVDFSLQSDEPDDEPDLVSTRRNSREHADELAAAPALFSEIEEANLTRNPALPLMIGSIVLLGIVAVLLVQGDVINVRPLWNSVVQTAASVIHSVRPAPAAATPSGQSASAPASAPNSPQSASPTPDQSASAAGESAQSSNPSASSQPQQTAPSSAQSTPSSSQLPTSTSTSPAAPAASAPSPSDSMGGTSNPPQPPPARDQSGAAHRHATSEPAPSAAPSQGAVATRVLPDISQTARESMSGPREVVVRVSVSRSGSVNDASYVSPGPGNYFARISVHAAEQWKFTAPDPDGRHPQPSVWLLRFHFTRGQTEATATLEER